MIEVNDAGFFLVFDECSLNDTSYVCILVGTVDKPMSTYLYSTKVLDSSLSSEKASQLIDDVVREFKIPRTKFLLLLTDAAPYMIRAGKLLVPFYNNMVHVTCIFHLLHNAAMKVRSYFSDVDKAIAAVKAALVKNKTRKRLFREKNIPVPPMPIVTRWGSWLEAALYYSKNIIVVKSIFSETTGGLLVKKAQEALNSPSLEENLTVIVEQYECLAKVLKQEVGEDLSIEKADVLLKELDFGEDVCRIKPYFSKRIQNNGISSIWNRSNPNLSPLEYANLKKCQATSISVERCFSQLNKLLSEDRNFNPSNIEHYLVCKFNSSLI
jgi:hypothetical protein